MIIGKQEGEKLKHSPSLSNRKNESTGMLNLIGGGGGSQKRINITYGTPSTTLDQMRHLQMQHSQRFNERFNYENRHIHDNESGWMSPERGPLAQLAEKHGYL